MTAPSPLIRVAIVDDQAMVRAGFQALLDAQPDLTVVAVAADGDEVAELVRHAQPDVVLMDIRMPRVNGLDATRAIHATASLTPPRVIILTTFDADDYVFAALRAGASGFLLKDATPDELVAAIRIVAAGDALLAPAITRRLIEDYASRPAPRESPALTELTEREREVTTLIAQGNSNAEIAAGLVLSEQTVKTHVSRVLTKLGLRDRTQLVIAAYEAGLVTVGR